MELSRGIYQLFQEPDGLLAHTEELLDKFDNSLNKVTQTVEDLTAQLLIFNSGLRLIYEPPSPDMNYLYRENGTDLNDTLINTNQIEHVYERGYNKENEKEAPNGAIKAIENIGEFAGNTKKIVSAFEEFSPKIKRLGTVLETISDVSEGVVGAAKLLSATESGMTATESITTAGEIIAGATGIAEVGSAFGPPGWIVAGVALTVAGITAVVSDDDEKRKKKREKQKKEEREEAQYQSALETFQMPETSADQYLKQTEQLVKQKYHPWTMHRNVFAENLKKYGADTTLYEPPVARSTIDQLYQKRNLPPGIQNDIEDQLQPALKKSFLDKTYEIEMRLEGIGRTEGKAWFDVQVEKEMEDAYQYDKTHTDKLTPLLPDVINQAKQNLLKAANENRLVPDKEPRDGRGGGYSVMRGNNQSGRTININLNRPMIEYFTINTNGVKEGLNDFKHKVEEALLEILHSANAIQ